MADSLLLCVCVVERVTNDEYCYAFFQQDFPLAVTARASMDTGVTVWGQNYLY